MSSTTGSQWMPDDDMSSFWRDVRDARQAKRSSNREASPAQLVAAGITFTTHNGGAHLVVSAANKTIDFWPGTGLWKVRGTNREGRGVRHLISLCTNQQPAGKQARAHA